MFGFRFSKVKYKKYKQIIEPQEIFLDRLAQKREKELSSRERRLEVPVSRKALKVFLFSIILIIFVLFLRTSYFQIFKNKEYLALANENKFIIYSIKSDRGVIYDSEGNQLVSNKPSFDLVLNKSELPEDNFEKEQTLRQVAQIIKQDYDLLKNGIDQLEGTILISENLDHQTLILLETKIDNLKGFHTVHNSSRQYQDGPTFAHLVGYLGKITDQEYVGKEGLEKSYQDVLEKNPGKIQFERDVHGNLLSKEIISLPGSGRSLVLWLKSSLQEKIKEALEETLERTGAKKAVGIALDPKTGGVLALVSIPSYDNNLFTKGADQEVLSQLLIDPGEPLFNRAVSGLYSTGSTIKPLVALAALEEEIIPPKKKLNCQGEITIPHRYDPEITYYHKDWMIHGPTDMEKAIAESCNVYFYTIGGGYKNQPGLGPSRIKKYTQLFGWGSKTGSDLPAEAEGLMPDPDWKKENKGENWWDGDTYNLAIGQGDISITPLQVAVSFVAIANRGTLFKPQVVKQVIDYNKNVIEEIEPEIIRNNFINPENMEIVRQGMRKAVTGQGSPYASSILLNSLPVSAAAKTGTAQTPIEDRYHNWVSVFAPYDDPEIVLTIMIEDIKGVQAAALPTAKKILEYYFKP